MPYVIGIILALAVSAYATALRLDKDRAFLKQGGVFTDDVIDAYIKLKMQEVTKVRMSTHPLEFELYYSV